MLGRLLAVHGMLASMSGGASLHRMMTNLITPAIVTALCIGGQPGLEISCSIAVILVIAMPSC